MLQSTLTAQFPPAQPSLTEAETQRPPRKRGEKYDWAGHWFPSLPFQQFQVLFNSLFKVLCIFPSRYLYAIGLPPIFSFRWNLPPTLSCNPKQLDSTALAPKAGRTGVSPSQLPCSNGLGPASNASETTIRLNADSHGELLSLQSPLLRQSWLVSFPPLNYMLKFSGSSCLI